MARASPTLALGCVGLSQVLLVAGGLTWTYPDCVDRAACSISPGNRGPLLAALGLALLVTGFLLALDFWRVARPLPAELSEPEWRRPEHLDEWITRCGIPTVAVGFFTIVYSSTVNGQQAVLVMFTGGLAAILAGFVLTWWGDDMDARAQPAFHLEKMRPVDPVLESLIRERQHVDLPLPDPGVGESQPRSQVESQVVVAPRFRVKVISGLVFLAVLMGALGWEVVLMLFRLTISA